MANKGMLLPHSLAIVASSLPQHRGNIAAVSDSRQIFKSQLASIRTSDMAAYNCKDLILPSAAWTSLPVPLPVPKQHCCIAFISSAASVAVSLVA